MAVPEEGSTDAIVVLYFFMKGALQMPPVMTIVQASLFTKLKLRRGGSPESTAKSHVAAGKPIAPSMSTPGSYEAWRSHATRGRKPCRSSASG